MRGRTYLILVLLELLGAAAFVSSGAGAEAAWEPLPSVAPLPQPVTGD